VADVQPFERMKLRLLNAGHSALGYLGHLAGLTFVHEAASDPQLARLLERFMEEEVSPLLPPVPGIDLAQYRRTLVQRFANAAIADRLGRLCAQGSAKMPKFVLPTLREQLARGVTPRFTTLIVAAYLRYLGGLDERGQPYVIEDALAPELTRLARAGGHDPRPLLGCQAVFGSDLAHHAGFVAELAAALRSLHELGVKRTLTTALEAAS
jgi:mannitol-1-phosphate/altronate dehydrogenase